MALSEQQVPGFSQKRTKCFLPLDEAGNLQINVSLARRLTSERIATRLTAPANGEALVSMTILLVEDEPLISWMLEEALSEAGFEVIAAFNGSHGIEAFEANATRLEVVITDIRLGEGLSGWNVGNRVRELAPTLPVLYISGDSSLDWPQFAVSNSKMMAKPFDLRELVGVVTQLIASP
jgi:CheY-like chemotaxis protein